MLKTFTHAHSVTTDFASNAWKSRHLRVCSLALPVVSNARRDSFQKGLRNRVHLGLLVLRDLKAGLTQAQAHRIAMWGCLALPVTSMTRTRKARRGLLMIHQDSPEQETKLMMPHKILPREVNLKPLIPCGGLAHQTDVRLLGQDQNHRRFHVPDLQRSRRQCQAI